MKIVNPGPGCNINILGSKLLPNIDIKKGCFNKQGGPKQAIQM